MSEHKLLVLSDLHMDIWEDGSSRWDVMRNLLRKELPEDFLEAEAVFIAGDLSAAKPGLAKALRPLKSLFRVDAKMMFTPGNHEYYHGELDDGFLLRDCEENGVIFAQKSVNHVGATRILSCTLWSDGLLFGEEERPRVLRNVQKSLNDYLLIAKPEHGNGRIGAGDIGVYAKYHSRQPIGVSDTVRLHEEHLAWLENELAKPHDGPTLVITHHGPHPDASLPVDAISAGFVSDLSRTIEQYQPDAWVFGHTHRPQSCTIGKTRVHNVGLGYPFEARDYEVASRLLRGCLIVGDEIRFVMDESSPRPN